MDKKLVYIGIAFVLLSIGMYLEGGNVIKTAGTTPFLSALKTTPIFAVVYDHWRIWDILLFLIGIGFLFFGFE
jgi:hypothetical protein